MPGLPHKTTPEEGPRDKAKRDRLWAEAKRRYPLSAEGVRMARAMGLNQGA